MQALRRISRFVVPYRWALIVGLLTTVFPVIMELVVPRLLQYVIDQGIATDNMNVIWTGSAWMFSSAILGALATLGQGFARAKLSQGVAYDMRNALFSHIQSLSFANLDRMQTGQLMTRLSSDVDVVRMFASAGLSLLIRAILMIVGSLVMAFLTDWQLALIVVVMLLVAGLIIRQILVSVQPLFSVVQQKLSALNTTVQESLAGVQVVKAFVREPFTIEQFEQRNSAYLQENIRVGRLLALAIPMLALVTNIGMVTVIWVGGIDTIGGRLSVGELVAFNNYLLIGMAPLLLLSNILAMISRAVVSSERILDLLDTRPAVQRVATPHRSERVAGEVVFEDVSFRYQNGRGSEGSDGGMEAATASAFQPRTNGHLVSGNPVSGNPISGNPISGNPISGNGMVLGANGAGSATDTDEVLEKVSFAVSPGQSVALLGATGSGKSTLVNLIPRFYDVDAGRILIDGVDVREWSPDSLRKQIGVVLQQTTLFSGTIRENIAFGRPEASLEEVMAAAQAAQAHEFIAALPDGYESQVEERGVNLSGGQRQRVAIARALLIAPGILILDDSTSAVDMETEFKIQQALESLMLGRTTFIVAQRISSVLKADQILVLDAGRIAAQGTHRELLASSSIYREIYQSQLGNNANVALVDG
jgi:ATP-binding cassette subfamily B multidrug efflux pump